MTRHFWIDLAERAFWTFLQSGLAALGASAFTDIAALEAAAIAGIAAVLSLIKSVAAHRLEALGTAQLIPFTNGTYTHGGEAPTI